MDTPNLRGAIWAFGLVVGGCLSGAIAAPAPPPARPVLVELFTSQGCSSCPVADAFIRELPRRGLGRDRVVALAFHVDYWDGLGWKDPFASPAFSERQRQYVKSGRLTTPRGETGIGGAYTPQMIVDGAVHFSGARRDVAQAEIALAAEAPAPATLSASASIEDPDHVLVSARLSPPPPPRGTPPGIAPRADDGDRLTEWRLMVALAMRSARTLVMHGENAGEALEEASIVRVLSDPVPISAAPSAGAVRVSIRKPRDLDWGAVELTAFVQSVTTLHVVAVRDVSIPLRPVMPDPTQIDAVPRSTDPIRP